MELQNPIASLARPSWGYAPWFAPFSVVLSGKFGCRTLFTMSIRGQQGCATRFSIFFVIHLQRLGCVTHWTARKGVLQPDSAAFPWFACAQGVAEPDFSWISRMRLRIDLRMLPSRYFRRMISNPTGWIVFSSALLLFLSSFLFLRAFFFSLVRLVLETMVMRRCLSWMQLVLSDKDEWIIFSATSPLARGDHVTPWQPLLIIVVIMCTVLKPALSLFSPLCHFANLC